jgi:hypothetical protein
MADYNGEYFSAAATVVTGSQAASGVVINSTTTVSGGGGGASSATIFYRGRSGGNYVYSVNTPPVGATDVVIIARIAG